MAHHKHHRASGGAAEESRMAELREDEKEGRESEKYTPPVKVEKEAEADGYGGHTQVLALFDRSGQAGYRGLDPGRTTVDHLAFEIDRADYAVEKARLERLGVPVTTAEHAWVRWRSLYVDDPEGNTVEWVCYDESVG